MRNLDERITDINNMLSDAMKDCKRSFSIIEDIIKSGEFKKPLYGEAKIIEDRVNNFESNVEEEVVKTIARFQPMAINLRFLVSVIKMSASLERINDLSINILKVMKYSDDIVELQKTNLPNMLVKVQQMFDLVLKAYFEEDLSFAYLIMSLDEEVNTYKNDIIENIKKGTLSKSQLETLFISQHFERIGDSIKNLAETIIYIYNGIDIRHGIADDTKKILKGKK